MSSTRFAGAAGVSLLDLLFATALAATLAAIAVPSTAATLEGLRAAGAARYVAGRLMSIRMEAVRTSRAVAFRFHSSGSDYIYTPFADGNGNGVRTADILAGIDRPVGPPERLIEKFPGVQFLRPEGVPDADGGSSGSTDGVRIGTARLLTMSPDGTATSGTLYLAGKGGQYAVRVLGATGRVRVLSFNPGDGAWHSR